MYTTKTVQAFCGLCGAEYAAPAHVKAYASLCKLCWSSDVLREWDRLASARSLKDTNTPDTLSLAEWMHTVAAFHGKCCLCLQTPFSRLTLLDIARGLVACNCVPCCKACDYHLHRSFERAVSRVTAQMAPVEDEVP